MVVVVPLLSHGVGGGFEVNPKAKRFAIGACAWAQAL